MSGYYWTLKVKGQKKYDPGQRRVPAGNSQGGQWTSENDDALDTPKDYETTGDQLGILYHGGKSRITKVDPEMLQSRDHGYYGHGFYMTTNKEYAKWYGRTLSKAKLPSDTRVLISALSSKEASPRLVQDIKDFTLDLWEKRAKERGKPFDKGKATEDLQHEVDSPTGWAYLVTSYGSQKGYDVIKHSDGEIVVRNYDKLEFMK